MREGNAIETPKRKRGRPKIHPDRKAYQAEWVRKKRAKLTASKAN